jgi:hypothetical protein
VGFPRTLFVPVAILVAAVAVPLATAGADPTGATLTIAAKPNPITYQYTTVITGTLEGTPRSRVPVRLEQNPFPFTAGFGLVTVTTTDQNGNYRFLAGPLVNTRYRTSALVPPASSGEILVKVRTKVVLHVSDPTPNPRERVEFAGTVTPEHDGRLVYIQQRKRGRWRTVARARLKDTGTSDSAFLRRIRVRRSGTYRARVRGDFDHAASKSASKRLRVFH